MRPPPPPPGAWRSDYDAAQVQRMLSEARLRRLATYLQSHRLTRTEAMIIAAYVMPGHRKGLLKALTDGGV